MKSSLKSLLTSEKQNKIAEWFLLLFIAECTIGSSGRWLEIGPFSIRMILFALGFFSSFPAVIRNIKKLALNIQVIVTVCFGIYLLFCAWLGLNSGNRISFIFSDLTTLMTLALVPGFMAVMCNRNALERAIKTIFWLSSALAIITVCLHFLIAFSNETMVYHLNKLLNSCSLGGLAILKTGIHRIYLKSQVFFQVAIVYGIWLLGKSSGKKRILVYISEGILFCGCILSYTRGFWLGLAASALLLLLIGIKHWKQYMKSVGAILAVFTVFICASSILYRGPMVAIEVVNRFNPNLIVLENPSDDNPLDSSNAEEDNDIDNDIIEDSNMSAVNIRAATLAELDKKIAEHPIIGNGLGENLEAIRSDGRTEYMYLDIMMKTGIIGLLLFIVTFFGFIIMQIHQNISGKKQRPYPPNWDSSEVRNHFLTAGYIGVAVTSFFNPFLNNPMGIMLLMLTATAVYEHKLNKCEEKLL